MLCFFHSFSTGSIIDYHMVELHTQLYRLKEDNYTELSVELQTDLKCFFLFLGGGVILLGHNGFSFLYHVYDVLNQILCTSDVKLKKQLTTYIETLQLANNTGLSKCISSRTYWLGCSISCLLLSFD